MELNFGEYLAAKRVEQRLTTRQVSEKVGCTYAHIRNIEMGVSHPSTTMAFDILKVLGVPCEKRDGYTTIMLENGDTFSFRQLNYKRRNPPYRDDSRSSQDDSRCYTILSWS